jgi:hypothetical protein
MIERADLSRIAVRLIVIVAWTSPCTYSARRDVILERLTWFSYMNDDIRAQHAPGALDRDRFV